MAGILVVDDSPTKAHKMVNTFVRLGHQVLTAMTASDGVKGGEQRSGNRQSLGRAPGCELLSHKAGRCPHIDQHGKRIVGVSMTNDVMTVLPEIKPALSPVKVRVRKVHSHLSRVCSNKVAVCFTRLI